jgi:hypothetical protein
MDYPTSKTQQLLAPYHYLVVDGVGKSQAYTIRL